MKYAVYYRRNLPNSITSTNMVFEVFTVVTEKVIVVWNVTTCSLVDVYLYLLQICLHFSFKLFYKNITIHLIRFVPCYFQFL
jgi:hypothetical protein